MNITDIVLKNLISNHISVYLRNWYRNVSYFFECVTFIFKNIYSYANSNLQCMYNSFHGKYA